MAHSTKTLLFYGLNIVRVLSVVALLLVFSSGILDMVNNVKAVNAFQAGVQQSNGTTTDDDTLSCDYIIGSSVPNQPAGVFWAVLSSLLIIFQSVILILSEVGWPVSFFNHYFPVLGSDFGVGALGIFQGLIGAQILSHHVDEFTLVSAFFLFSIGCLNMLLGLIFREGIKQKRSILRYQNESRDVLPTSISAPVFVNANPAFEKSAPAPASEFGTFRSNSVASEKSGYGFGRQGEKAAGLRGFILQKPEESLPRYASPSPAPSRSSSPSPTFRTYPSPPPVPQQPSTSPLRLQRNKSAASSFASPGAVRHERRYRAQVQHQEEEEAQEEDEDEEDIYDNRSETPPPTFRSSPSAI